MPHVAGVRFSFDETAPAASEIKSAGTLDDDRNLLTEFVRDGAIAGDKGETFGVVPFGFLATGGDGYPFPLPTGSTA